MDQRSVVKGKILKGLYHRRANCGVLEDKKNEIEFSTLETKFSLRNEDGGEPVFRVARLCWQQIYEVVRV